MSMRAHAPSRKLPWSMGLRLLAAGLLGVAAAVALVSCGSSGKGLIPLAEAGPLRGDFEAVAQAAQNGNGDCTATTEAINKTEQDFAALPVTIDAGLHQTLSKGIANLRERALALCAQPLAQTTTTSAPRTTTTTTKTETQPPPTTQTTSTQTTPTPTTPTTPNNGGGTVAPGNESPPGVGPGGGTGAGEAGEAGSSGGGAGEAGGGGLGPGNGKGENNGKGNNQ
jgi:hypothetical protein